MSYEHGEKFITMDYTSGFLISANNDNYHRNGHLKRSRMAQISAHSSAQRNFNKTVARAFELLWKDTANLGTNNM